jgi:hypothetical protein
LLKSDLALVDNVDFVSEDHDLDVFVGIVKDFIEPEFVDAL